MEDCQFDSKGRLLSRGHNEYTVPTIADCPAEFDVTLLRGLKKTEQGWKFFSFSHCQELCQQASWLLIGGTRVNNQSEARSAS